MTAGAGARTRAGARVGVIGWPVAHSRSPVIFAHWFERYGIDATYERLPVPPDGIDAFFAALPDSDLTGVNVTAPHKIAAARSVALDGVGERLGSVNTVWRDGELRGTSSDGAGFLASLDDQAPGWREARRATILGAGGAAIAVADALATAGLSVAIANRTPARAEALAAAVGGVAIAWATLPDRLGETDLLVNATSLGMAGAEPLDLDIARLPERASVADIVYDPLRTPLLSQASARGLATVDGLGMLLHQATVGFEKWFGLRPEVDDALRAKVAATL